MGKRTARRNDSSAKTAPYFSAAGFLFRFVAFFVLAQVVFVFLLGDNVQKFMVEQATVVPGTFVIGSLFPDEQPVARGDTIRSESVNMRVLRGCEGTELYLLLGAAILAFGAPWKQRLIALLIGGGIVFALNQARLLCLYVVVRDHFGIFQLVHVYIAPLVLIGVLALCFSLWANRVLSPPRQTT
ncbi:MAG: hypothetical protein AAFX10_00080 [Pseudomonadota bacterium]